MLKVRVEVTSEDGMKTSMEREGDLMNEAFKSSTIRSVVRFLEEQIPSTSAFSPYEMDTEDLTIKGRLEYFLRYDAKAPRDWFTSSELKRIYEEVYGVNIRLSTLSTYLASLHSEGILIRKGSRAQRRYKVVPTLTRRDNDTEPGPGPQPQPEPDNTSEMELMECVPLREIIQH